MIFTFLKTVWSDCNCSDLCGYECVDIFVYNEVVEPLIWEVDLI